MDNLDKTIKYNSLYDIYKNLLTEKQRTYFEEYFFLDQSLGEIAEKHAVSRNAVYSQLQDIENSLDDFESKLHLKRKNDKMHNLLEELKKDATDEQLSIIKTMEGI